MKNSFSPRRIAAWCAGLAVLLSVACSGKSSALFAGKNVLLISIDTCRADYLEPYGGTKIETPALNAVARGGFQFMDAVTPVPLTLPAHATLLTGLHPIRHGVRDNFNGVLSEAADTIAERFRDAGYATAGVVGAILLSRRTGLSQGFDYYNDEFKKEDFQAQQPTVERKGDRVLAAAEEWIDGWAASNPRKPFFLFLHFYDPHMLYQPPSPFREMYKDDAYGGEIAFVDACIGNLIVFLKEKQLYDELLLVIVGDHGEGLKQHEERTHGLFLYENTVRVPFFIRFPQSFERHRSGKIAQSASLEDVAPTLADLCGLGPLQTDGLDLVPWFLGRTQIQERWTCLETQYPLTYNWSPMYALRNSTWKYIHAPKPELYNLQGDPGETHNLVHSATGQINVMSDLLENRLIAMIRHTTFAPQTSMSSERAEALASLGYVAGGPTGSAIGPNVSLPDPKDKIKVYDMIDNGLSAFARRNFSRAVELFENVILEDSHNPTPYLNLGLIYAQQSDWEPAAKNLEAAVLLAPQNYHIQLQYAKILITKGDVEKGRKILLALIHEQPQMADAHYNLGRADMKEKKHAEAVAHFEEAKRRMPDMPGIDEAIDLAKSNQ